MQKRDKRRRAAFRGKGATVCATTTTAGEVVAMKEQMLYTFSYGSSQVERTIKELIILKIPVVDVRLIPVSHNYMYSGDVLKFRPGIIYHHIPNLGNDLYREARKVSGPLIGLHDVEAGLVELKAILDEYGRAAIFCACSNKKICHRILVAQLAKERYGVRVVHV
jgi:uncharacterized protein (DUF488 family)